MQFGRQLSHYSQNTTPHTRYIIAWIVLVHTSQQQQQISNFNIYSLTAWLGEGVVAAEVLNRTGCQARLRLVFTKKWFHLSEEQW